MVIWSIKNKTKIKKVDDVWRFVAFGQHMRINQMIKIIVSLRPLICLNVLFLLERHVHGDSIWFGTDWIFFFYHFSLIHLNLQVDPQKIHSKPSFSFIFRFSPCSFNCNFFILKKYFKLEIIFNLILQFFLSPIFLLLFSYLGWFIKLIFFFVI